MILSIDPTADPGTYNCTILLSDLNAYTPLTSEYKFEITLAEVANEDEQTESASAEAVNDFPSLVVEGVSRLGILTIQFA